MGILQRNHYFTRKLHSLSGVIPLGAFLAAHLWTNFKAVKGPEAYNTAVEKLQSIPFLPFVELAFIILPILFHGLYGAWIYFDAKNNATRYPYGRNWLFYFQRLTGVLTLIFVFVHLRLRIEKALSSEEIDFYQRMIEELANPWMLGLYIVGVLSAIYHFTNGLSTFLITWGITIGPKSQKWALAVSAALFVLMSIAGVGALLAFVNA
jgi:succinate dehydrogenase / fumarate reductase cytochrome b subunit